jgi:hypothetical protein
MRSMAAKWAEGTRLCTYVGLWSSIRAMPFMLDSCIIHRILDGEVGNEWPLLGDIFVTDIQLQEVLDTRDPNRCDFLFSGLTYLRPNVIRPRDMFQLYDGSGEDFDTGERLPRLTIPEWYYASVPLAFGRIVPLIATSAAGK